MMRRRRGTGIQPTYQKVKGFQPLQMTWGRVMVDAVFRGGKKHSNHGDTAEGVIALAHGRGCDELVHRGFKDFGHEELPFKQFAPNAAYYYLMAVSFFLFECFKEDVNYGVVPVSAHAARVRRTVIDFAAKLVHTGVKIILTVTTATWKMQQLETLWKRCVSPPRFA